MYDLKNIKMWINFLQKNFCISYRFTRAFLIQILEDIIREIPSFLFANVTIYKYLIK